MVLFNQLPTACGGQIGRPQLALEFVCAEPEPVVTIPSTHSQAKLDFDSSNHQLNSRYTAGNAYKEGLIGAPCIQIGSFNCPVEHEEEVHAGYVQQRMPAQCDTGSCIRTRKLNSVAGWAKHAILYEFASLEGFNRDYEAANAKSPLGFSGHSIVPMLIHAPSGPNSALRIWPPVTKAQA